MEALNNGTILHGKFDYKVTKCLGNGGFGITYLALSTVDIGNISHQLPFAIKEFCMDQACVRKPDGSLSLVAGLEESFANHKKEFLSEAERLSKLEAHDGIVRVNEVFHQNNTVYYVMEYLGDENLVSFMSQHGGVLKESVALDIFRSLAEALRFIHSKHITHLDVKPANVMLHEKDGKHMPVLIDFGLATHYGKKGDPTHESKSICCTDGYSPLEQYLGVSSFSPEADIYALGATLLFMLSGKTPPVASQMNDRYVDDSLAITTSLNTRSIIKKCMQKLPELRFRTIDELLEQLENTANVANEPKTPHTRVIGHKRVVKTEAKQKKISIDPAVIKIAAFILVGIIIIAIVILGAIKYQPSKNSEPLTTEIDTTRAVTPAVDTTHTEIVKPEAPQEKVQTEQAPAPTTPQPKQPVIATTTVGTIDLGYATYTGDIKDGKPDGKGKLVFHSQHEIEARDPAHNVAESGDMVEGTFKNGHFAYGKWYKSDGTTEKLIIGSN